MHLCLLQERRGRILHVGKNRFELRKLGEGEREFRVAADGLLEELRRPFQIRSRLIVAGEEIIGLHVEQVSVRIAGWLSANAGRFHRQHGGFKRRGHLQSEIALQSENVCDLAIEIVRP